MPHRYLFITILLCFSQALPAQTADKLEKANGFKEFKLGTERKKWENETAPTKSGAYRYTGKNHTTAFGSSVHRIYLRFDSLDRLSGVYISIKGLMGKSGVKSYKNIIGLNYGKETKKDDAENSVNYQWDAQNIKLTLYGWEDGNTWSAKLCFTSQEQYAKDTAEEKGDQRAE